MPDDNKLPEQRERIKADALASILLGEFRGLIETARQRAAQALSAELVLLYWRIGARLQSWKNGSYELCSCFGIVHL